MSAEHDTLDGAGLLTRRELAQLTRVAEPEPGDARPWLGSAGGEVRRWRERAERAEAELDELRRRLRHWRAST